MLVMLWFLTGFKLSCECVCLLFFFFIQHLFVGRGKNETFLIWKVAYENYRLVQPDSEDLFYMEMKMLQKNLPALAKTCYFFLNTTKCKRVLNTWNSKCLLWKLFTFFTVVTETKVEVLPKRNVTFPFHSSLRGSVLWVHQNKAAVKRDRKSVV